MRSGAILLVECDQCHTVIEAPLTLAPGCVGVWESYGVNGYLAREGWVSDQDGNDYCSAECRRAATRGRRTERV